MFRTAVGCEGGVPCNSCHQVTREVHPDRSLLHHRVTQRKTCSLSPAGVIAIRSDACLQIEFVSSAHVFVPTGVTLYVLISDTEFRFIN